MRAHRTRAFRALAVTGSALSLTLGGAAVAAVPGTDPVGGPQLGPGLAVNLAPGVRPVPATLTPKAWLVADLDTGQVLGAYDAHVEHKPASTMKTLAALAMIPTIDPAAKVPFTARELGLTAQKDGRTTLVGLVPGTSYSAKRLFEAMLALSANDATEALAAVTPGGRAGTLASMNAIAATLQARDTHAATPDGLDGPGQQISAYDLALIARAAITQPGFLGYDTVPVVKLPSTGRGLGGSNHDRLQNSGSLLPGAHVIGGKDGYTTDSGQVWWGAAEKNGHRIVVTEMDAGFEPVTQEISLLNWGFAVDGKITPAGTLVPPVSAAGVPEPLTAVTHDPPVSPPAAPRIIPVAHRAKGSGPWAWILGAFVVLAAAVLGRRHFMAARPAGAAGTGARARLPAPRAASPSAVPVPVVAGPAPRPADPVTASPIAPPDAGAGRPAVPVSDPGPRPWEATVTGPSVVLRSPARGPAGHDGRRSDDDLETKLETWRRSRVSASAVAAEQSKAERLRTGAVRVIPASAPPDPTVSP